MTGYTDTFGGSTLQAAQVAYAAVSLSANLPLFWPPFCTGTQQPCARLMDVTPTGAGLAVLLPDARLAGLGQDVFFSNPGAYSYTVQDSTGGAVAVIAPGTQRYIYLIDNTTAAGTWRTILMGVGASSPDASGLAGAGLKVIGATLNQAHPSSTFSANTTFSASDRARTNVNNGGAVTGTLPLSSAVSNDYFLILRNQGTGVLTVAPTGGELIDGSATIALQLNESCIVQAGVGAWYTIGRGRNTQFNFTQLIKNVTGLADPITLSLTEASNVVQTYSGTATHNNTIVLPAVVQVYYISNNVLGGFSFNVQSPTPGAVLTIPYGQAAVVFTDGVNVINASTSVGGITALLLANGSASAPSLAVGASNNGVFSPTSTSLAVTTNGSEVVRWSAGQELVQGGSNAAPSYSFAGYPDTGFYAPTSGQIAVSIGGSAVGYFNASGWVGNASTATTANTLNSANAYQAARYSAIGSSASIGGSLVVVNDTSSGSDKIALQQNGTSCGTWRSDATNPFSVVNAAYSSAVFTVSQSGAGQFTGSANAPVIQATAKFLVPNGSAANPSIAFSGDGGQDTGFFWNADGTINWSNNGVQGGYFSPGNTYFTGNVFATTLNGTHNGDIGSTCSVLGYSASGQGIINTGQQGPMIFGQGGGAAALTFHRPGSYAVNFGLNTDNNLTIGGWTMGATHIIQHSGNTLASSEQNWAATAFGNGTTNYNTGPRPIMIVSGLGQTVGCLQTFTVNGTLVAKSAWDSFASGQVSATICAIVPVGASYVWSYTGGAVLFQSILS